MAASPLALARVPFRGGHLLAAQVDGEVFVPLLPVCEALGLDPSSQLAKLKRKPWATVVMNTMVAGDGKARQLAAVDLRSLPLWLATIEPSRVRPEAREALVAYQREAAEVLFKHFLAPGAGVGRLDPEVARLIEGKIAYLESRTSEQRGQIRKLQARLARSVPRGEVTALRYQIKHLEELQAFAIERNVTPSKAAPPPPELTERLVQKVWEAIRRLGTQRFTAGQIKVKDQRRVIGRANDTAAALAVLVARGHLTITSARHGRAYLVVAGEAAASGVVSLWPAPPPAPPPPPAAPAPRRRRARPPSPCPGALPRPRGRSPATTSPPCSPPWWPSARPTRAPAAPRPGLCSPPWTRS